MTPTDALGPRAAAQVLRSILPSMERFGVATAEEVAAETFAQRLHADLISTGAASTLAWLCQRLDAETRLLAPRSRRATSGPECQLDPGAGA